MLKDKASKKILIVDDDEYNRTVLENIIGKEGYQTHTARDGASALKEATDWLPDLVLLDIVMPGSNGLEVLSDLRAAEFPHRPAIVMLSGKGDKPVIAEALLKGADDFVVKPVDELELIARLRAHLRAGETLSELEHEKKVLENLLEITNATTLTLDTDTVLNTIVQRVAEETNALRCSIVLVTKENKGFVISSHEDKSVKKLPLDLEKYPEIIEAISTRKPIVIDDIADHPLMESVREHVKDLKGMSLLVVPVIFSNEVLGTIFLRTEREGKGYTQAEIDFCTIVANSSYNAIKNARVFEEVNKERERLEEVAITDQLTKLYNQHFFYKRLEEEFERAIRYDTTLSVIMMDLDDFKRINDTYGHTTGDKVLREVAGMIKKSVRKIDIVARYGGEELAVILPHTPLKGAVGEAERIRKTVSDHSYAGLIKEVITVSMGVCSFPAKGIVNSGDLVNLADNALYDAKHAGKNRVLTRQELESKRA